MNLPRMSTMISGMFTHLYADDPHDSQVHGKADGGDGEWNRGACVCEIVEHFHRRILCVVVEEHGDT